MPALAGVGLYSAGVIIFANGAAILFGFHLGSQRAVAQIVRAFNGLLHGDTIPSRGRAAREPLATTGADRAGGKFATFLSRPWMAVSKLCFLKKAQSGKKQ